MKGCQHWNQGKTPFQSRHFSQWNRICTIRMRNPSLHALAPPPAPCFRPAQRGNPFAGTKKAETFFVFFNRKAEEKEAAIYRNAVFIFRICPVLLYRNDICVSKRVNPQDTEFPTTRRESCNRGNRIMISSKSHSLLHVSMLPDNHVRIANQAPYSFPRPIHSRT